MRDYVCGRAAYVSVSFMLTVKISLFSVFYDATANHESLKADIAEKSRSRRANDFVLLGRICHDNSRMNHGYLLFL